MKRQRRKASQNTSAIDLPRDELGTTAVDELTSATLDRTFVGMHLSLGQQETARVLVATSLLDQLAVDLRNPEAWQTLRQIEELRDKRLRELLTTEVDRAEFDRLAIAREDSRSRIPTLEVNPVLCVRKMPALGGYLEIAYQSDGMLAADVLARAVRLLGAYRSFAERSGLSRMHVVAESLERRDMHAAYTRCVTRAFARDKDGHWIEVAPPWGR